VFLSGMDAPTGRAARRGPCPALLRIRHDAILPMVGGLPQDGPLKLGGMLGTPLAWIMTAYMIYSIAVLLIQLIWTCEDEELELGVKRELRSCHPVGS
jgi:hypothetical protein